MGHTSTPKFCTFHALRIKGFATVDTLREMTGFDAATVQAHLDDLAAAAHAQFREARSLWQLTPDGRAAHPAMLETDLVGADLAALAPLYAGSWNSTPSSRHSVATGSFATVASTITPTPLMTRRWSLGLSTSMAGLNRSWFRQPALLTASPATGHASHLRSADCRRVSPTCSPV